MTEATRNRAQGSSPPRASNLRRYRRHAPLRILLPGAWPRQLVPASCALLAGILLLAPGSLAAQAWDHFASLPPSDMTPHQVLEAYASARPPEDLKITIAWQSVTQTISPVGSGTLPPSAQEPGAPGIVNPLSAPTWIEGVRLERVVDSMMAVLGERTSGSLRSGTMTIHVVGGSEALILNAPEGPASRRWKSGAWDTGPDVAIEVSMFADGASLIIADPAEVRRLLPPAASEGLSDLLAATLSNHFPPHGLWGKKAEIVGEVSHRDIAWHAVEEAGGDQLYLITTVRREGQEIRSLYGFLPEAAFANNVERTEVFRIGPEGQELGGVWWMVRTRSGYEALQQGGGRMYGPTTFLHASGSKALAGPPSLAEANRLDIWRVTYEGSESSREDLAEKFEASLRRRSDQLRELHSTGGSGPMGWRLRAQMFPPLIADERFMAEAQNPPRYRWGRPLPSDAEIQRAQFEGRPFLDPAEAPGASGQREGAPAAVAPPARPAPSARLRTAAWVVGGLAVAAMVVMWLGRRRRRPA